MTPAAFAERVRLKVDLDLQALLTPVMPSDVLQQAMAYSALAPGKRLRPQLVYLTGELLGADPEALSLPASAIELIHAYSLIHDDLPAMDNAPLRRGRPTCHRQFSEATAILAGDALQTLAFDLLASHSAPLTAEQRLQMIQCLASASGREGMAGGQSLDLAGNLPDADSLTAMYQLKTGALLSASSTLGAIAAGYLENPLGPFAHYIGLAFQIQDDLLDMEGTEASLGKLQGIDQRNQKVTYPLLTSAEESRQTVTRLFDMAMDSVPFQDARRAFLQAFAEALIGRTH